MNEWYTTDEVLDIFGWRTKKTLYSVRKRHNWRVDTSHRSNRYFKEDVDAYKANIARNYHDDLRKMVEWIGDYMVENGYSPNAHELCHEFAIGTSTFYAWRNEAKGLKILDWTKGVSRSYQVPGVYYVDDRSKDR